MLSTAFGTKGLCYTIPLHPAQLVLRLVGLERSCHTSASSQVVSLAFSRSSPVTSVFHVYCWAQGDFYLSSPISYTIEQASHVPSFRVSYELLLDFIVNELLLGTSW